MKTIYQKLWMNKIKVILFIFMVFLFSCNNEGVVQAQSPTPSQNDVGKKIKIALLLDTSNSMDGLIEQAKSQLWQLVNELAKAECDNTKPVLEIALYEYGNDNLSMLEGYIRQVTPLTSDLDQVSSDLFSLKTNGGDEFCGQVIKVANTRLDWSSNNDDLQIIFIAGNEPFTQGNVSYKEACANSKEKNIIVNTIFCGDFNEGVRSMWKDGADITGGSYMSINHNSKTVYIESPYDDEISSLNVKLNDTYIGYGSKGKMKKEMQVVQDANAELYGKANTVKRTVSKSSHFYSNKEWDLVDASKSDSEIVNKLEEEQLPEEMKGMNEQEKKEYVDKKKTEREEIQKDIQALNVKREAYIAEKRKESDDTRMLDNAMLTAIKEQAKAKNFTFKQ